MGLQATCEGLIELREQAAVLASVLGLLVINTLLAFRGVTASRHTTGPHLLQNLHGQLRAELVLGDQLVQGLHQAVPQLGPPVDLRAGRGARHGHAGGLLGSFPYTPQHRSIYTSSDPGPSPAGPASSRMALAGAGWAGAVPGARVPATGAVLWAVERPLWWGAAAGAASLCGAGEEGVVQCCQQLLLLLLVISNIIITIIIIGLRSNVRKRSDLATALRSSDDT